MNKGDLVTYVSDLTGVAKKDVNDILTAAFEGVIVGLKNDKKVSLSGFGVFSAVEKPARKARNPKTGAEVDVPARTVAKFRPGKEMKETVNQ